jgi:adenine-specific DNA-methyltransferase
MIIYLVTKSIPESILQKVLDGCVFNLYFKIHMQEKQIDILQFVEKDLAEAMQGRDFEQLPDSEKETIINQLHARWTHPDSEVRNRIKLFAVRSPDILKPILESR